MPRSLIACRQPGCAELIPGGGFCSEHQPPAFAFEHRIPLPRNWNRIRARILRRDGHRCVLCKKPAVTVDHIVARARGGSDDDANLRSLCEPHRRAKDAADAAAGGRSR